MIIEAHWDVSQMSQKAHYQSTSLGVETKLVNLLDFSNAPGTPRFATDKKIH